MYWIHRTGFSPPFSYRGPVCTPTTTARRCGGICSHHTSSGMHRKIRGIAVSYGTETDRLLPLRFSKDGEAVPRLSSKLQLEYAAAVMTNFWLPVHPGSGRVKAPGHRVMVPVVWPLRMSNVVTLVAVPLPDLGWP